MRSFRVPMLTLSVRAACLRAVLALVASAPLAFAQQQPPPLAAVARAEQARRKAVATTPGKRYTNADLAGNREGADTGTGTGTPSPVASTPAAGTEAAPAPPTPEPPKDEKPKDEKKDPAYWRQRMATAREQLERTQMFALALESRVNGLWADFTARDDPAQRSVVEQDRQKAIAELERVKREVADQTKAIAAIEDEARRLGVPPGWLR